MEKQTERHCGVCIEIDEQHSLMYLLLRPENRAVSRSIRMDADAVLDLDAEGRLVGIELLGTSAEPKTGAGEGLMVGTKEAAAVLRVKTSNFIRDHSNRKDFPPPVVEVASGRLWLRSQVERYAEKLRGQHR